MGAGGLSGLFPKAPVVLYPETWSSSCLTAGLAPAPHGGGTGAQVSLLVRRHVASIFLCGCRLAAPKPGLGLPPPWLCRAGTSDVGTVPVLFPGGASGEEPACPFRRQKRRSFSPQVGKVPWRRAWHPTPVFLPGESHGQRSLTGYSPWGSTESDTTERLSTQTYQISLYA